MDEIKIKRKVWRRRETIRIQSINTFSVKHGGDSVVTWACMTSIGSGPLVFINDLTADRSSSTNSEVYRSALSALCCKTDQTELHSANG